MTRRVEDASLGANCLPTLFLHKNALIDAHCAALDAIAAAGFRLTEISQPALLSRDDAPRVRRHTEASGLAIRAVHAPLIRRDLTLVAQRAAAELAAELGAALLVVHTSSLRFIAPDPAIRAAARERDLHRLEALTRFCEPLGITLGLENGKHPAHPEYLLSLIAQFEGATRQREALITGLPDPPSPLPPSAPFSAIGLVFDAGHAALRGGDVLQTARAMLPRLVHTHLHDNHGTRDEHLPPGRGQIDWPTLLALLRDSGYTGARLLELRPRPGEQPEQWHEELAEGRAILSSLRASVPPW